MRRAKRDTMRAMTRTGVRLSLVALAIGAVVAAACSSGHHGKAAPQITAVTPGSAVVGDDVTISGSGLGATQGASVVTFDGVTATVVSWSATAIHAIVPDSFPGSHPVSVTVGTKTLGPVPFDVVLPHRLYVMNSMAPGSVSAYSIDAAGGLTALGGSPFPTGAGANLGFSGGAPLPISIDVARRRLFVSNTGSIAVFDIGATDGSLTAVAGSPFSTGTNGLLGVAVTPNGRFVFASLCGFPTDRVMEMSVASDGTLTAMAGAPPVTGGCLDAIAVTPDGARVIANTDGGGLLYAYDIAADGTLGSAQTITQSGAAYALSISPGGKVYSPNYDAAQIDGYTEAGSPLPGSPFAASHQKLSGAAWTRDGAHVYVSVDQKAAGSSSGVLSFDSSGSSLAQTDRFFVNGYASGPIAVSTDGRQLFLVDQYTSMLHVVAVASNGAMSEIPGSPFANGADTDDPLGVIVTP